MVNNYMVDSLLTALKRRKGAIANYKSAISLHQVLLLKDQLDLSNIRDAQLWAIITAGFYGMLRLSSMTLSSPDRYLRRSDVTFTLHGVALVFNFSKTIQFKERLFTTALPRLPGSPTCPTWALTNFFHLVGDALPDSAPALAFRGQDGACHAPTPSDARTRLLQLFKWTNISTNDFNSHSLRRGGASHLLGLQVPISTIRILGDWKSDAIFRYLLPPDPEKVRLAAQVFSSAS